MAHFPRVAAGRATVRSLLRPLRQLARRLHSRLDRRTPIQQWHDRAHQHGARAVLNLGHGPEELAHVTESQRALLLPLLQAGRAHVTTQVSVAADQGSVNWNDVSWASGYDPMKAYSSSKIALGLFAIELDRRSADEGWGIRSNLSHPGVTPTNLLAAQGLYARLHSRQFREEPSATGMAAVPME